jgi:tetratricopeptide (TPR) repeat protein
MHRNPWFTLAIGLMVGLVVGYILAERQPVPPARALALGLNPTAGQNPAMPEGHPPVDGQSAAATQQLRRQVAEIEGLLSATPDDPRLLAAMGNVYFDAERWQDARGWYEKSLELAPDDINVLTDLAVVERNLGQPERALALLDRALAVDSSHWQALYNKVVVYQFDLHQHDAAADALRALQQLKESNPQIPDLAGLEREVLGS